MHLLFFVEEKPMKYIIMCGGPRSDRPLQKVKDETIIARTLRLLRENKIEDIAISTLDPRYEIYDVPILQHDNPTIWKDFEWLKAFYPMTEPACYIFGDVFFSPAAIRTIVDIETDDIQFFASARPFDPRYIKRWAEPFAFKVKNTTRFFECVAYTIELGKLGRFRRVPPISWELWQVIKDTELNRIDYTNYIAINDYTVDPDNAKEVAMIQGYA